MSRSYRHHPIFHGAKTRGGKKFANRKIRSIPVDKDIGNFSWYKKNYCQYDIYDYWSMCTEKEFMLREKKEMLEHLQGLYPYSCYSSIGYYHWLKWYHNK